MLATVLSLLIVAAADAQTPPPKPPAKPPAAAPAPQQAAAPAQGQQQLQLLYSPWAKFCGKGQEANGKPFCMIGKNGRLETGQPAVAVVLIQPEGGPNLLRVTLPLAMQLQPGARVMVDQARLASMKSDTQGVPYTVCTAAGCIADFEATPDVINQLKKGKGLRVQGFGGAGELLDIPLPLEDFAKILDGPPTDPKVIDQEKKMMQDELSRRADELRKKLQNQQGATVQPGK
ncbi:MAG: invasion associated locus B family protein [Xanthobacteraceae bacterium]